MPLLGVESRRKEEFYAYFLQKIPCNFFHYSLPLFNLRPAFAASEHTREEVRAYYQETRLSFSEDPFLEAPVCHAPYAVGSLKEEALTDALNSVKFMRYPGLSSR